MPHSKQPLSETLASDLTSSMVVALVALPLCLGVALASNAPLFSGLLAGIIGGILVGLLSGSHTSVSGPAAGLTAVVAAQIALLGSFQTFLLAVLIAGVIQIGLGIARAGVLAAFFPSSVIKGLLAAIGVILILKQIPHVLGHDTDPEGEMSFDQPDHENTFTELVAMASDLHWGAALIGLASIALLVLWDKWPVLKKSLVPAPLVVVLGGVALAQVFRSIGGDWLIESSHLVQVPVAGNLGDFLGFLQLPDFSQLTTPAVYTAGITIGIVASLETLLNLKGVDKLDPRQRISPANRELVAQGVGNMVAGLVGGLPVTSVIVRSSVNINAGGKTKLAAILHGVLILGCVMLLPTYLNLIPLSALAAILLVTGLKLVSPQLVKEMWDQGRHQFIPFATTVLAIVFTDLLKGVLIGLAVAVSFILQSNLRRPLRLIKEKHLGGEVLRIELASQVSFLNRAALEKILYEVPRGGQVLLDARGTVYIDPDILDLVRDFNKTGGPADGVQVSLLGFRQRYQLEDNILYVDYSSRQIQEQLTPKGVLNILLEGNERFRSGRRLTRDLGRQVQSTAEGQHPLAVVLSCIDSRSPAELVFDLGLGDIFSVRIAGNITSRKVIGSMEYGCSVAGAKIVLVMGHTRCGAVTAAVNSASGCGGGNQGPSSTHLDQIVLSLQESIDPETCRRMQTATADERRDQIDLVARRNVLRVVDMILEQSELLRDLLQQGKIWVVGGMYDVATGHFEILTRAAGGPEVGLDGKATKQEPLSIVASKD